MTDYPNWFATSAIDNFATYLVQDKGLPDLKYLQLGAFTGDASVWLLDNILTGQGSRLTDVDTWEGSDEIDHKSMDFDDVFATYKKKIAHKHNITIVQRTTTNFLVDDWAAKSQYDFIYIDADHTTVGVLLDAELSWPLLKSGGIMAFDDLTWGADLPPSQLPKAGILLFAERHSKEFDLIVSNTQYWIKKK